MVITRISCIILLVLIFSNTLCSSTAPVLAKVISAPPTNNSIDSKIPPLPSASSVGGSKDSKQAKIQDAGLNKKNDESKLDKKDKDNNVTSVADPPISTKETTKGNKDKVDSLGEARIDKAASCEGLANSCRNQTLVACIHSFRNDSKDVSVLVQNVGEDILSVHINILPSVKHALLDLQLQKHERKMVNVTLDSHKSSSKVILNAGNGECVLQLGRPVPIEDFLQQVSMYSKQVTPLYGALFFFMVALLFGGTGACCWFRKRRVQGGVQYQELEMGLPKYVSAVDVESAEGWDQDWDDDWDDDDTVKSSSAHHSGSISANGLTSRTPKTEGWENGWDD